MIFHTLFPENSLTPLGVSFVTKNGKTGYGMVSEVVKQRSHDYKLYQQWWYVGRKKGEPMSEAIMRHETFVEKVAIPLARKIHKDTGIQVNEFPVNVCNINGRPVFF